MADTKLIGRTFLHCGATAVYRVRTAKAGDVLMRVDRTNYRNDQRAVVVVNAGRFHEAWKASGSQRQVVTRNWLSRLLSWRASEPEDRESLPYLSLEAMARDRKFADAEKGFQENQSNPVPLAEVGFSDREGRAVDFTNGITRTMWLLVQGAKSFPVECRAAEAARMAALVGECGTGWATVESLTADLDYRAWLEKGLSELPLLDRLT